MTEKDLIIQDLRRENAELRARVPQCGMIMTNADKIRSMSDDELALWICGVYDIEEENGKFINGIIIPGYAPHDIEEWLQQPSEEGE